MQCFCKPALVQKIIINVQKTISFKENKIKLYCTKFKCNNYSDILNYLINMSIDLENKKYIYDLFF